MRVATGPKSGVSLRLEELQSEREEPGTAHDGDYHVLFELDNGNAISRIVRADGLLAKHNAAMRRLVAKFEDCDKNRAIDMGSDMSSDLATLFVEWLETDLLEEDGALLSRDDTDLRIVVVNAISRDYRKTPEFSAACRGMIAAVHHLC